MFSLFSIYQHAWFGASTVIVMCMQFANRFVHTVYMHQPFKEKKLYLVLLYVTGVFFCCYSNSYRESFFRNTIQYTLTYTHARSPLCSRNPTPMSISKRLSRRILEIDEVTVGASISLTATRLPLEE
jgi:hypothetical protein